MSLPNKAITKYTKISQRCDEMVALWQELRNHSISQVSLQTDINDLLRAAIVLKVAGMDAYFTDKFIEMLVPFLRKKGSTPNLLKVIEESGITLSDSINLMRSKKPLQRVRTRVKGRIRKYVTQHYSKIDALYRGFGYTSLCSSAKGYAKDSKLVRNVYLLVRRRNGIVHNGDCDSKGNHKKIAAQAILNKMQDIDTFVYSCEHVLNSQLKTLLST